MARRTDDFADQAVEETLRQLGTDPGRGLAEAEANARLTRYGPNEIEAKDEPLWHRVLRRFWGPIPGMIEIAAVLSAVVRKWEDFTIILIMLGVNAFLDFFQEHRALNALAALRQRLANEARVLRAGKFQRVEARLLVPGDIVKLRLGDIVPADLQLIDGDYLSVDQSAMTGESLPVNKKPDDVVYANTIVGQGEMRGVVVNTGHSTNFSAVVALVAKAQAQESSHFQKLVIQIGNYLMLITAGLVTLIVLVALFRHENLLEILRFALVLAVAAIPVALPAVLSVTLAVGALALSRRQAIVSRLVAIEELAGIDVLCTDKTGTLTRNELEVSDPILLGDHPMRDLLLLAVLASQPDDGDPIDTAVSRYVDEQLPEPGRRGYRRIHFTPFDPVRKRTEAVVEGPDDTFEAIKGAPQVLVALAGLDEKSRRDVTDRVDDLASRGYRTLAVGRRTGDTFDLVGLLPLLDPPRDDSKTVIDELRRHGVAAKMITGDNLAIAREVGRLLGLEGRAIRSGELKGTGAGGLVTLAGVLSRALFTRLRPEATPAAARSFSEQVVREVEAEFETTSLGCDFVETHESELVEMIESVDLFAEVVPEDKFLIVDRLQKAGHFVAMTGDGVNDAPALKRADCGIAVSNATDAARAAADIILTAPGLGVIHEAVTLARTIFERMKSYSIYRIAETIRILLFMTLSIVVFDFYPITALMIIILALLNDIPILAIAYDHTRVDPKPVRWNMHEVLTVSTMLGISGVISSFLLFFVLKESGFSETMIRSLLFAKLVVAGHGTIYNTRTEDWFWKKPYPSALLFWATLSTAFLGTLIAVYGLWVTPIGWRYAGYMWGYALIWFVVNDVVKMTTYRLERKHRFSGASKNTKQTVRDRVGSAAAGA